MTTSSSPSPVDPKPAPPPRTTGHWILLGLATFAGIYATLTPLLALAHLYEDSVGYPGLTAAEAGKLGQVLAVLLPAGACGLLTITGVGLVLKGYEVGRFLMMGATVVLFGIVAVTALSVGPRLLLAALLLTVPSLWLKTPPKPE